MVVTVKLFGAEAKAAGMREVPVEIGEATCLALREELARKISALAPLLPKCRFAVNHEFVELDRTLVASDEIALIGMVSGG